MDEPARADHPRIRGEHFREVGTLIFDEGSSPHTRGAPERARRPPAPQRIIPAYAGSTGTGYNRAVSNWDHPRIRGEHVVVVESDGRGQGSSPHTRGARRAALSRSRGLWIIPAYAGSTKPSTPDARTGGDHPRIRGEHVPTCKNVATQRGSSPHTRGAPGRARSRLWTGGIIPAYAGSTPAATLMPFHTADHPRIRGEHVAQGYCVHFEHGSSPHTRGARLGLVAGPGPGRIIPAYAGSTSLPLLTIGKNRDHPRIRGEHDDSDQYVIDGLGSSPHTRGALPEPPRRDLDAGIIPAYAGSTSLPIPPWAWPTDHPRIRGEHFVLPAVSSPPGGSSPHTRGALAECGGFGINCGIIPAYAGSTATNGVKTVCGSDHPRIRGEHLA